MVGISNNAAGATLSINGNTLRGWATSGTVTAVTGMSSVGAVTSSVTHDGNALGTAALGWIRYAFANSGALTGISRAGSTTATLSISNNDFEGIVYVPGSSGSNTYITRSNASSTATNVNSNTFTDLNVNTTGSITFLTRSANMTATGSENVNGNAIVNAFNKGDSGGTVTFFGANGSSVQGSTMTNSLNNFSNMTVAGSTTIAGWSNVEGLAGNAPVKTISNNTFNNITANSTPTGAITAMSVNFGGPASSVSNNTISNISGGGAITCMSLGASIQATLTVSQNLIDPIASSGAGALTAISSAAPGVIISYNEISDLSGKQCRKHAQWTSHFGRHAVTVANNLIGNLTAPAATGANAINGINITSTTASSSIKVYYNTVYLNNTSSGSGFGSSGLFHTASGTATTAVLDLRNNIIVNTSTPNWIGTDGRLSPQRRECGHARQLCEHIQQQRLLCGHTERDQSYLF